MQAQIVFTDPRFSNDVHPDAEARHMGMSDPPQHTRLRASVAEAFTPRRIRALRPRVRAIADELLDALPTGEAVDLVAGFGTVLPLRALCELIGFPAAEQRTLVPDLLRLSAAATEGDPEAFDLSKRIRERLHELADSEASGDGALAALVAAREDGRISGAELDATILLLISAGHEAPADLISSTVLALVRDPALAHRLREDPARIPAVVEETLRHEAPSPHSTSRRTLEAVTLGGVDIPEGALVLVNLAAANRDPARHEDPDVFDPGRAAAHMSFGYGAHFCLGAPLARVEAEIAVTALLERFAELTPAEPLDGLPWKPGLQMRGLRRLPVVLGG